jgi:hypothetical protein
MSLHLDVELITPQSLYSFSSNYKCGLYWSFLILGLIFLQFIHYFILHTHEIYQTQPECSERCTYWNFQTHRTRCSHIQLFQIEIWKMKNVAHGWIYTLKCTWHLGREISHFSVQIKLDSFFKPALLDSKNKNNFWAFYRIINIVSFYSF